MSQNIAKIILGIIFTSTILWAPFQSHAQEIIPEEDLKEYEEMNYVNQFEFCNFYSTASNLPDDCKETLEDLLLFDKSSNKEKAEICRFYEGASNLPPECRRLHSSINCFFKTLEEKNANIGTPKERDGVCIPPTLEVCNSKKNEIIKSCNLCQKGATKITHNDKEIECKDLLKLDKPEEIETGITCQEALSQNFQCTNNSETPTLQPFNSEFFNVTDPNGSGLTTTGQGSSFQDEETGGGPLLGPIFRIINFLVAIISTLTILGIVYGSFRLVTSGGDDNNITKGKDIIKNSIIALVIVMASYTLVRVTQAIIFNLVN